MLPAYEAKSKAEPDTPLYMYSKTKMNALTGKFAQLMSIVRFYIGKTQEELGKINVHNIDTICDEMGKVIAFLGQETIDYEETNYPIHLSAFILAWSKVCGILPSIWITQTGKARIFFFLLDQIILYFFWFCFLDNFREITLQGSHVLIIAFQLVNFLF